MTKPKSDARANARARAVEALAERRRRDAANAQALEAYFTADHAAQQVQADLDTEIENARTRAAQRTQAVAQAKRESLRALQANGETAATIADLTGLPARDVRELLRAPHPAAVTTHPG
jgi:hypothetical protein